MIRILRILMLCFVCTTVNAQRVDEKLIYEAKALRATYPDEDALINFELEHYTFDRTIDKEGKEVVIAYVSTEVEYLAIKENAQAMFTEGYGDKIIHSKFRSQYSTTGKYKNGGTVNGFGDREYNDENIFDNDTRIIYRLIDLGTTGARELISYNTEILDIRYLGQCRFGSNLPVLNKKVIIEIPDWLNINVKEMNFKTNDIKKTSETASGITTITYEANNIANRANEKFTPNINSIFAHLLFLPQAFNNKTGTKIKIFETVGDLYSYYNSLIKQMKNDKEAIKPILEKIIQGKNSEIEKIKAIYYYVQDNIKYIAFERGIAGFKPENADVVLKNKYGDCKGMANLLTNMLQLAGFDARLAWIGTRGIIYDYSTPCMAVDNHMICALKFNNKFYYLDGTEKYCAFDDYAFRIQGRQVLIMDGENYKLETVPDLPIERNLFKENTSITLEGELLKAKVDRTYNGESKGQFLNILNGLKTGDASLFLQSVLSNENKNFTVSNLSQSTFTDRERPIEIGYDIAIANQVTLAGNDVYIAMDYSNDFEAYIPTEKRKNEMEVDDRTINEYTKVLLIPDGLSISSLPKPLNIETPNYTFKVNYKQEGNKVIFTKFIKVKEFVIEKANMQEWKKNLKLLKDINNEQIILTKH